MSQRDIDNALGLIARALKEDKETVAAENALALLSHALGDLHRIANAMEAIVQHLKGKPDAVSGTS